MQLELGSVYGLEHTVFVFLLRLTSSNIMFSRSINFPEDFIISFVFIAA